MYQCLLRLVIIFVFLVGVVPSFILKSDTEVTISYGYPVPTETKIIDTEDESKSFDLGKCFGFEHEFEFDLNYGLRVNHGMLKVDNTYATDYKNFSILASVGYSFGFR